MAGDWAVQEDRIYFAPAAFAPAAYHLFAAVDGEHDWAGLTDQGYKLLNLVSNAALDGQRSAGLPPGVVRIDRETGAISPPDLADDTTAFDAEAAQVYWRVALDYRWHEDGRALSFLGASDFLSDEWARKGALAESYAHDGAVLSEGQSLTLYSAVLPKFRASDS